MSNAEPSNSELFNTGGYSVVRLAAGQDSELRPKQAYSNGGDPLPVLPRITSNYLTLDDHASVAEDIVMQQTWYLPVIPPQSPSLLIRLKTLALHLLSVPLRRLSTFLWENELENKS
jgi:hypothetical protein